MRERSPVSGSDHWMEVAFLRRVVLMKSSEGSGGYRDGLILSAS